MPMWWLKANMRRLGKSTLTCSRKRDLSYIDEAGRVTVIVAGQWTHEDQEQIYHALNLPPEAGEGDISGHRRRIRRSRRHVGADRAGAGNLDFAPASQDPMEPRAVHSISSQAPSDQSAGKMGARLNPAVITAIYSEVIGDAGAYNYTSNKVLGQRPAHGERPLRGAQHPHRYLWRFIPITFLPAHFVGSARRKRCFAAEGQMNRLAQALDMDPLEDPAD